MMDRLREIKACQDRSEAFRAAALQIQQGLLDAAASNAEDTDLPGPTHSAINSGSAGLGLLDPDPGSKGLFREPLAMKQHRKLTDARLKCASLVSQSGSSVHEGVYERRLGTSGPGVVSGPGVIARLSEMRARLEALVSEGSAALSHLEMQVRRIV